MDHSFCPQCGRVIQMGDRFCGNCRYMLPLTKKKKTLGQGIRDGLVPAIGSWVGCLVTVLLWSILTVETIRAYGALPVKAFWDSITILVPYLMVFPLIGCGLCLLACGCFANSKWGKILSGAGITAAMCCSSFVVRVFAPGWVYRINLSPDRIYYTITCVRSILMFVPLVQGSLFCIAAGRKPWKAALFQLLLVVCILVVSVAGNILLVSAFMMGFNALLITCLITGTVSMTTALVSRIGG